MWKAYFWRRNRVPHTWIRELFMKTNVLLCALWLNRLELQVDHAKEFWHKVLTCIGLLQNACLICSLTSRSTIILLCVRMFMKTSGVLHALQSLISCFQPNALVYYIFSYSSTCFEPYCAHNQEDLSYIYTASGSLCVTLLGWPLSAQAVRGLSSNCLCTKRSHKNSDIIRNRCCVYTIEPPDDEHNIARNM